MHQIDLEELTARFTKYVQIDTESDPFSTTQPSTMKQKDLARVLVAELHELGISDAHLDEYGYVYATLEASPGKENAPVICFCSHMDTSPDSSGKNVKPILHKNYQGQDLVLPDDSTQVITTDDHPKLLKQIGNDVFTASGTTLLGADNKAGLAEIMCAVSHLIKHPEISHCKIRILFTPDEEIGRGVDKVDIQKLGARYGYTVDGEERATMEDETFSADSLTINITGVSAHPGFAKGKLESAIKIAGDIISRLPKTEMSPETTEGREGFLHPVHLEGKAEKATIGFILRDFDTSLLKEKADFIQKITDEVLVRYPNSSAEIMVKEQYRNMKEILKDHPQVADIAVKAMEMAGMTATKGLIRGGTDGSRLSFMGLPCPNIFAGEHAFHSKHEWVSLQDMADATSTIINIAHLWADA